MSTIAPRKKPSIQWNDASYKAFLNAGKSAEDFKSFDFSRANAIRFFNRVDLNFSPLKQKIETMARVKVPQVDDNGEEIGEVKEYVYYTIRYQARDSWKQRIACEVTEGRHQVIPQEQIVKWQLINGQPQEQLQTEDLVPVIKYTIPFSAKAVQEIIKKHNMEGKEDEIIYYWKAKGTYPGVGGDRHNEYTYDQFVTSEFEHLAFLAHRIGGAKGDTNLARIDPAKVQTGCNCSDCQKQKK